MTETGATGNTWFLRRGGVQSGPYSSAAIRRLLLLGQAELADEVSPDRQAWARISGVPEVVPPELRDGVDPFARGHDGRARRLPWLSISLFLLVFGGAIGFGFWWGGSLPDDQPECDALPAPGVNWSSCQLTGLRAAGSALRVARLGNADLAAATLAGADLSEAVLDYANLRQSDLGYALLRGASLRGADLRGADLTNADLSGADLSFANLTGARIGNAQLAGTRLGQAVWITGEECARGSVGGCVPARSQP